MIKYYYNRLKKILLDPAEFFTWVKTEPGYWESAKFLAVVAAATGLVNLLIGTLLDTDPGGVLDIIISVVVYITTAFIGAAFIQFFAKLLKGRGLYIDTFKAVANSHAALVVSVVPAIGGLVASVWMFVLLVVGLKKLHSFTTGKAVLAATLPGIALGLLFIILALIGSWLLNSIT